MPEEVGARERGERRERGARDEGHGALVGRRSRRRDIVVGVWYWAMVSWSVEEVFAQLDNIGMAESCESKSKWDGIFLGARVKQLEGLGAFESAQTTAKVHE